MVTMELRCTGPGSRSDSPCHPRALRVLSTRHADIQPTANHFDMRQWFLERPATPSNLSEKVQDSQAPHLAQRGRVSSRFWGAGLAGGLTINVTNDFAKAITALLLRIGPSQIRCERCHGGTRQRNWRQLLGCVQRSGLHLHSEPSLCDPWHRPHTETVRGKRECVAFQHGQDRFYIGLTKVA